MLVTGDPLISRIWIFKLDLEGDRIGVRHNLHAPNIDLLTHIEHFYISEAFRYDYLW
jgi:hypothetical protein